MNKKEEIQDLREQLCKLRGRADTLEYAINRIKREMTCDIPDSDYPHTTASVKDIIYLILEDLCLKIAARPFEIKLEPTYED